jgi:hypothetical protein
MRGESEDEKENDDEDDLAAASPRCVLCASAFISISAGA